MKPRYFTIPNLLTLGNLLCGSLAAYYAFAVGDLRTVFWLVVIAAVLDFFDGFAARMLNSFSPIGKELDSLADTGHIGTFIGMLTDSRSFLSYPRHHYFRRILCDWLGRKAEDGEICRDMQTLGKVVRDISYNNAARYFGLEK